MATNAYLRLLEKARCTLNYEIECYPERHVLSSVERVDFLISRLTKFKVRGYSKEYIIQLVKENIARQ